MAYIWLIFMVILGIIETFTMQMVSIWLAGGALAAAIGAICGLNELWQIGIFLLVSILLLITTRPIVKRLVKNNDDKTNSDRLIGSKVIITEEVYNLFEKGKTVVNGVTWTVRSASNEKIEEGKIVTVEKIEGVKLIVSE